MNRTPYKEATQVFVIEVKMSTGPLHYLHLPRRRSEAFRGGHSAKIAVHWSTPQPSPLDTPAGTKGASDPSTTLTRRFPAARLAVTS